MKIMRLNPILASGILFLSACAMAETITIDFGADQGPVTYRASGFLAGMSASAPADSIVSLLKPKLFRDKVDDALSIYSRVKALGAKSQMCLRLQAGTLLPLPGTNNSWTNWENHVRTTVSNALANGQQFEWDIWNEPDGADFWTGTIPQFYETWRRAVVIIRSLDPNAVIVGPSVTHFNFTYIKDFLQYAKTNNVLPSAVSWHEIGANATVRGIAMNVQSMRAYLAAQGMNIQKIYINEMTSMTNQHNPGLIVRHFAEIEKAKVDGACKSCWSESGGSNCHGAVLDGIITKTTRYPRAAWWAYRRYADITGRLVGVTPAPTPYTVDGVAGQDAVRKEARAVFGRYAGSGSLGVKLVNLSNASFLTTTGSVHVLAERIPNSGEAQLAKPLTVIDADYPIADNSLQFTIPDFPDSNAFAIRLTAGSAPGIEQNSTKALRPIWRIDLDGSDVFVSISGLNGASNIPVKLTVHDVGGRIVQNLSGSVKKGGFTAVWNTKNVAPGAYIFRLAQEGATHKKIFVIP